MHSIWSFLSFVIGFFSLLGGVLNITKDPLTATSSFLLGIILFPPISNLTATLPFPKVIKTLLILLFLGTTGYSSYLDEQKPKDSRVLYELKYVAGMAQRYCKEMNRCPNQIIDVKTLPNVVAPSMIKPEYYTYTVSDDLKDCTIIPKLSSTNLSQKNTRTCMGPLEE